MGNLGSIQGQAGKMMKRLENLDIQFGIEETRNVDTKRDMTPEANDTCLQVCLVGVLIIIKLRYL